MDLYFLSYDLRNSRNYDPLYKELARLNAVRILESTWCFKFSGTTPKDIRDHFKQFVDSDDGFIVSLVTNWASWNTNETPNDLN